MKKFTNFINESKTESIDPKGQMNISKNFKKFENLYNNQLLALMEDGVGDIINDMSAWEERNGDQEYVSTILTATEAGLFITINYKYWEDEGSNENAVMYIGVNKLKEALSRL